MAISPQAFPPRKRRPSAGAFISPKLSDQTLLHSLHHLSQEISSLEPLQFLLRRTGQPSSPSSSKTSSAAPPPSSPTPPSSASRSSASSSASRSSASSSASIVFWGWFVKKEREREVDVVRGMVHRGVDGLQVERGLTGGVPGEREREIDRPNFLYLDDCGSSGSWIVKQSVGKKGCLTG